MLAALLDKSLIRMESGGRYAMHALLRQYAVEKLRDSSASYTLTRDKHTRYFMTFLVELEPSLQHSQPHAALAAFVLELDNVREAWRVAVASGRGDAVEGAVESLYTFFDLRCRFQEGIDLFAQIPETWTASPELRCAFGKVIARRGALERHLDHYQQTYDNLQRGLAIAVQCNCSAEHVFCLTNLAEVLRLQGEYPASLRHGTKVASVVGADCGSSRRDSLALFARDGALPAGRHLAGRDFLQTEFGDSARGWQSSFNDVAFERAG